MSTEMAPLRIGLNVPQDSGVVPEELRQYAADAEAAGYDSLWTSESVVPGVLDPLAVLNFVAAATRRPMLGVAVLLAGLRSPLQLARDLASLDQLAGGRLILGVGIGNDRTQYAQRGVDPGNRGRHFEETLTTVDSLLRNERTTSSTPWWELDEVPRPLASSRQPAPPLWFGARKPAALDRAVRLGQGWIGAGSMLQADFETALGYLQDALERAGRDERDFTVAKRVYLHVVDDRAAFEPIRSWFAHHYRRADLADAVVVHGDAEECAAELRRLRALGVSYLILHPVIDLHTQLRRIADEVVPRVVSAPQ